MSTTPNDELLKRTLRHIIAHPQEWDQELWAVKTPCGTACCYAGTAAILAGHQIRWSRHGNGRHVTTGETIHDAARVALGLTDDQADDLFDPGNSLIDICRIVRQITGGRVDITPPPELADATSGGAG